MIRMNEGEDFFFPTRRRGGVKYLGCPSCLRCLDGEKLKKSNHFVWFDGKKG